MLLFLYEFYYIGICLGGFLFGLYSGIFALYLQCLHASKTDAVNAKNILFYALCFLYILSVATIGFDIVSFVMDGGNLTLVYAINTTQFTLFACCDFIAQSILIYRCWIVWGQNIRVVIVPSILAFTFLATWLASIAPKPRGIILPDGSETVPAWCYKLTLTSLAASISVNALVTGLIVFKIFTVFQQVRVKPTTTSDPDEQQNFGATGGKKLFSVISVIIESGVALFSIQLARFLVMVLRIGAAYQILVCVHEILNGITPTIILVRVSMGLSFHEETLMSETLETLRFGHHDHPTGSINRETVTRNDDIGIYIE